MAIEAIEIVQCAPESDLTTTERDIQLVWLRVHTEDGRMGLGETCPLGEPEEAVLHDSIVPQVIGQNPDDIRGIVDELKTYFNFYGHAGAEYQEATEPFDADYFSS